MSTMEPVFVVAVRRHDVGGPSRHFITDPVSRPPYFGSAGDFRLLA
jgi:hypothetical protein